MVRRELVGQQHRREHRARAEAGDLHPLRAEVDRQPLGQGQRGALGDRVAGLLRLDPERCRRGCLQQVAVTPAEHRRQHLACGVDVRHHVQVPAERPQLVGLHVSRLSWPGDPGVAVPDVDLAVRASSEVGHRLDVVLDGDVDRQADGADGVGHPLDAGGVDVGHDHLGSVAGEAVGEGLADPAPRAGDDDHLVAQLHLHPRAGQRRTCRL